MATINPSPSPDTPITIKIALNNGENKRFKLALRDLGAISLPDKVCCISQPQPSTGFWSQYRSNRIVIIMNVVLLLIALS